MKKILYFIIFFLLFKSNYCFSQGTHYSSINILSDINPSYCGAFNYNFRSNLNQKTQWLNIAPYFSTIFINEINIKEKEREKKKNNKLSIGLNFENDKSGIINFVKNKVGVTMSTHQKINSKTILSFGINSKVVQSYFDNSKLVWGNQFTGNGFNTTLDNNEDFNRQKIFYYSFSSGVSINTKLNNHSFFSLGIAYHGLNKSAKNFNINSAYNPENKYCINSSIVKNLKKEIYVKPQIFIAIHRTNKSEIIYGFELINDIGLNSKYTKENLGSKIAIGLLLRQNDALIIPIKFQISKSIDLGFSYDFTISELKYFNNYKGGFEFLLRYNFIMETEKINNINKFYFDF